MNTDNNIFPNMGALSVEKDIPIKHLRAAKALNCSGFTPGGRWNWLEFQPWYESNKESVLEYLEENTPVKNKGEWKERKERALALIAEIELKERENKTLDKVKTVALLKQIFGSQAIILRNMAQDLPPRLLGKNITEMGVLLSKSYDDVCAIFQESLTKAGKK